MPRLCLTSLKVSNYSYLVEEHLKNMGLEGISKSRSYKQTDIGIIPVDWDVDQIKNICKITTGDKNTKDKVDCGKYPLRTFLKC